MILVRFQNECPGLAGSIGRLFGNEVMALVAADYCAAADLGGNVEFGLAREEGVSFNPRIARVATLVIQECVDVDARMLRVAMFSTIPRDGIGSQSVPSELVDDVAAVHGASMDSSGWIQGIALTHMLDRVRHLHMTSSSLAEKRSYIAEAERALLLQANSAAPEKLRSKVIHALALQARRLALAT